MAPQPACVIGPRQGVPCATMTHDVPRSLQSWQTLCAGIWGLRPASSAVSSSRSWRLSIGQPRSSKSTVTWSDTGVEVARVEMYWGCAYTTEVNSATSAKLRRAWIPPLVAHAPMHTSIRDAARIWMIRRASRSVVTEPSTRDTSYGPSTTALDASVKCAISTAPATASSSSSQSSRVSWQPSQDASFHTASLGLPPVLVGTAITAPLWPAGGRPRRS
jgi:hypothetical protein